MVDLMVVFVLLWLIVGVVNLWLVSMFGECLFYLFDV